VADSIFTTAHRGALAALCRDVGAALVRFGRALDASVAAAPAVSPKAKASLPMLASNDGHVKVSESSRKLGSRQQALLAIPGLRTDEGLSSAEVATRLAIAVPNAHAALTGLTGRNLIERVGEDKPARWRLVDRGQSTASAPRNKREPKKAATSAEPGPAPQLARLTARQREQQIAASIAEFGAGEGLPEPIQARALHATRSRRSATADGPRTADTPTAPKKARATPATGETPVAARHPTRKRPQQRPG